MSLWERLTRWEGQHRFAVDAAGTALFALVAVPAATVFASEPNTSATVARWAALAVVTPLAWRRVRPVASVVSVYVVALTHLAMGYPFLMPADLAVLAALYSVTVNGPRWAHRTAIAGALLGSLVLGVALAWPDQLPSVAITAVFCGAVALTTWAFGLVRRQRQETLESLRDRARRLEIERDQQGQIATAAERSRIAREMHDIVAHSLTVMIAQADGGRYAADADPAAASRALGTIAETGRAALSDMRRLLGVLRTDAPAGVRAGAANPTATGGLRAPGRLPDRARSTHAAVPPPVELGATADGAAPERPEDRFTPLPAEGDLDALVEQMRASGLHVSLVRMGTPRYLPPGAGLTVYRIAQESLTNVLKHAGPGPRVTVLVHWLPGAVAVEVNDDGRGAAADTDGLGQGVLGMRERAAMFGGTVTAGPRPGGGFRVRAQLPTPEDAGAGERLDG
ncbi:sensor histidine kinase [Cellulomonas soli]|uniref:histidine kinase n=1 Tax=Cellulomonas soli TaxID=931535 RepID=A0A512P841_9CELL|nr:histidine kinase [Cellulomonas soli]NYI57596.1 signal transduction histidine kinase [Cellulomonas soli]GEP67373.1 hypothetical protein CSO01_00880 [Cellulomonas soli]